MIAGKRVQMVYTYSQPFEPPLADMNLERDESTKIINEKYKELIDMAFETIDSYFHPDNTFNYEKIREYQTKDDSKSPDNLQRKLKDATTDITALKPEANSELGARSVKQINYLKDIAGRSNKKIEI